MDSLRRFGELEIPSKDVRRFSDMVRVVNLRTVFFWGHFFAKWAREREREGRGGVA